MPTAMQSVAAGSNPACHSVRCYDSGCELHLNGLDGPYILLNLENRYAPVDRRTRHCDFLLVGLPNNAGTEWVIPIELTRSKDKSPEYIVSQLHGGARVADRLLPPRANVRFKAVVGQKGLHRDEFNRLRKMRVKFRNRCGRIRVLTCGDEVLDALS